MEEAKRIIERLKKRIYEVVDDRNRLAVTVEKLKRDKEKLAADKKELEEVISGLEKRIRVLELSVGFNSVSGGMRPARDRVNKLLREVDKCLDLMNKY
ncbi:MAG: hypothetical protein LIO79_08260 [Rikenellaceae bacterium]|nr:hypothetical protein [Rikenellaceae bacterium]